MSGRGWNKVERNEDVGPETGKEFSRTRALMEQENQSHAYLDGGVFFTLHALTQAPGVQNLIQLSAWPPWAMSDE